MSKLTALTAVASASADDLIYIVDDPGGTPVSRKITFSNLQGSLSITESQISDLGSYLTNLAGETIGGIGDVTLTTIAAGELLVWNGSGWINNTLAEAGISATSHTHTEADITDLGSYLANVIEDTTPQLGGDLDLNGNALNDSTTGRPLLGNSVEVQYRVYHSGDLNTYVQFTPDVVTIGAGAVAGIVVDGLTSGDVQMGMDIDMKGNTLTDTLGDLTISSAGGNTIIDDFRVMIPDRLEHSGDSDTYIEFAADDIGFVAGATEVLTLTTVITAGASLSMGANNITFTTGDITTSANNDLDIYPNGSGELDLSAGSGGVRITTSAGNSNITLTPHGTGEITGADSILSRVNLKDYGEVTNALGDLGGGTDDIDLTAGNVVSATVSTATQTFTFSNPTASDEGCGFILFLTNGGSQTVNWPASVDWQGGTAPTLTAAGVDILVFITIDGGTTWHGAIASTDSK